MLEFARELSGLSIGTHRFNRKCVASINIRKKPRELMLSRKESPNHANHKLNHS
jgi:hypothetical protein